LHLKSNEQRIIKSGLWLYSSQTIKLLSILIIYPLIIFTHDEYSLGVWIGTIALVSFIHLSDLGFHLPWINLLSERRINNSKNFIEVLYSGLALFFLIILFATIIFLIFGTRIYDYLYSEATDPRLFSILVLANAFLFMTKIIRSVYRSFLETPKAVKFEAISDCLIFFVSLIALYFFSSSLLTLSILYFACSIAMFFLAAFTLFKDPRVAGARLKAIKLKDIFKELSKNASRNFLSILSNSLNTNLPLIIVTSLLGAIPAAIISGARTISNIPRQVNSVFHTSSVPEFNALNATNDIKGIIQLFSKILKFTVFSNIIISLILIVFGPYFLNLWLGFDIEEAKPLFFVFAIWSLIEGVKMVSHESLIGANRFNVVSLSDISATIISILLLYSLIEHAGIIAVPLAMLISTGIIGAPMLLAYQARLMNSMNFNKTILSYFLITLIAISLQSLVFFNIYT